MQWICPVAALEDQMVQCSVAEDEVAALDVEDCRALLSLALVCW